MSETIDLTARTWGHNYNTLAIENGGQVLKLAGWSTPIPKVGDTLVLSQPTNSDGRAHYAVLVVEPCGNPRDMWFATVGFRPRPVVPRDD